MIEFPLHAHGDDTTGMMFQQRGDNARSLHAFRAAARFTRNPNTLINVGVALARQGNNVQAIRALHAARMEGAPHAAAAHRLEDVTTTV